MWLRMKKQLAIQFLRRKRNINLEKNGFELKEGSTTLHLNEQLCKPKKWEIVIDHKLHRLTRGVGGWGGV